MRRTIFIALLGMLFLADLSNAFSQSPSPPKIKVILFGTFHYGETTDRGKTSFPDEFTPKRQQELEIIAGKLAGQHPDKIFVESEPQRQGLIDSLYLQYKQGTLKDSSWIRNEIVQLGFRTALKTAGKAKLICADHRQELPYDTIRKYEEQHKKDTSPPFFDSPWPFNNANRIKLANSGLTAYYVQLNNKESRERSMYDYLHYAFSYGKGDDYTGVDFTTSWYNRNFKIMTNILRALQPGDQSIVIIMGSSHTAILYELLKDHPGFDIIQIESVL